LFPEFQGVEGNIEAGVYIFGREFTVINDFFRRFGPGKDLKEVEQFRTYLCSQGFHEVLVSVK
jgi:hypothetical protein